MAGFKLDGRNPLAYMGVKPSTPPQMVLFPYRPTITDGRDYVLGTLWTIPKKLTSAPIGDPSEELWELVGQQNGINTWIQINASSSYAYTQYTTLTGSGTTVNNEVAPGAIGQILTSNGPGAYPSYKGTGGGGAFTNIVVTVIDTPGAGVYTPTSGMIQVQIECQAGGAGTSGLGINAGGSGSICYPGSGGGGYCKKIFDAATIGASQSYVVGAGGAGGIGTPSGGGFILIKGNDGDDSTFGALLTASGGVAASTEAANAAFGLPGPGGDAVGGDINIKGQSGTMYDGNVNNTTGSGGSSTLGFGAVFVTAFEYPVSPTPGIYTIVGIDGSLYGGGASGGLMVWNSNVNLTMDGADGADGVIIITEYIQ